jgi:hypothetical protein
MPLGVDVIKTLVVVPDEMVGNTEAKNSSWMLLGTKANSSKYIRF